MTLYSNMYYFFYIYFAFLQTTIPVTVQSSYNLYANGSVNLTSADPNAATLFNSNYFVVDDDIHNSKKEFVKYLTLNKCGIDC